MRGSSLTSMGEAMFVTALVCIRSVEIPGLYLWVGATEQRTTEPDIRGSVCTPADRIAPFCWGCSEVGKAELQGDFLEEGLGS